MGKWGKRQQKSLRESQKEMEGRMNDEGSASFAHFPGTSSHTEDFRFEEVFLFLF